MTIGEKIQQLRQAQGLSQEALAEQLQISRQAVSKWEKNLSYPSTENLLTLAELFHVSADELAQIQRTAERPSGTVQNDPPPSAPKRSHRWLIATAVVAATLIAAVLFLRSQQSEARPSVEQIGEFALLWQNEKHWESLALDTQDELFPFGTSLSPTESEQVFTTDTLSAKLHAVACGALHPTYLRITENNENLDTVTRIDTITPGYETPRGIGVGGDEQTVLDLYTDELVYLLKESGSDILCQHDYIYAYAPEDAFGTAILFYISGGHISGISIRLGDDSGNEAFRINNTSIFPMKDGKPDFSQRTTPDTEKIDQTRAVYIAFSTLKENRNLSNEEIYQQRQIIYSNLAYLDWQAYGHLGKRGGEDLTVQELLIWLEGHSTLSGNEMRGLLAGCCRTNLDGWMSESYAAVLARALLANPDVYFRTLAEEFFAEEERSDILSHTVYGCTAAADLYTAAKNAVQPILNDATAYTDQERGFVETFLKKMETMQ